MTSKPGVLLFLAAIQFLAPFGNILLSSYLSHTSVTEYISSFISENGWILFFLNRFAGQWISAYATFSIKLWSIPVCILSALWITYTVSNPTQAQGDQFGVTLILLSHIVNFSLILYFLVPAVRRTYMDRNLKLWETIPKSEKTRYTTEIKDWAIKLIRERKGFVPEIPESYIVTKADKKNAVLVIKNSIKKVIFYPVNKFKKDKAA